MTTALITHPLCLLHETNDEHPESPERLQAILDILDEPAFAGLLRLDAPQATIDDLALAHERDHITHIMNEIPVWGLNFIDHDTAVSSKSGEAALHAVGSVIAAVDTVLDGQAHNAFCAVRPPGHHAFRSKSGGFCLFNNIAIGALYALQRRHLKRVAIIDFDIHHGNGTQDIVWDNAGIFFASLHSDHLYTQSGPAFERGAHDNILNIPLPAGTTGDVMKQAFVQSVLPRLAAFQPEMIFVSAGYDGQQGDPLGNWFLQTDDYAWMMRVLLEEAEKTCSGRLVAVLEGGYHVQKLATSVAATITEMMQFPSSR